MFSKEELYEDRALQGMDHVTATRQAYGDARFLLSCFESDAMLLEEGEDMTYHKRMIKGLRETLFEFQRELIDHDPAHAELMEEVRDNDRTHEHCFG